MYIIDGVENVLYMYTCMCMSVFIKTFSLSLSLSQAAFVMVFEDSEPSLECTVSVYCLHVLFHVMFHELGEGRV